MMQQNKEGKSQKHIWPKSRPTLSEEQTRIFIEWYQYWLSKEGMQGKYNFVDRYGHEYATRTFKNGCKTLDIGAGNGAHIEYEDLSTQEYTAFEQSPELIENLKMRFPKARSIMGDCQKDMEFQDNYFDRVLAIHVLEHLEDLPTTLQEVRRILRPDGKFTVVIPCEGGLLYKIGRKFSSERMFVKKFHQSYDWLIKYDHINSANEVLLELKNHFKIVHAQYFPFLIPSVELEFVIGMTCITGK